MHDIRDVLVDLGYVVHDNGREYRMNPLYRDSSSSSVLRVFKDSGWWTDFRANKAGPFEELIRITLGLDNIDEAKSYLHKNYKIEKREKLRPRLESDKLLDKNVLLSLAKDNSYWNGRGVSESTLNLFDGGVVTEGKFKNRFVFPIFNGKKQLIGITGRDVTGKNPIKWLHQGATSKWCYPLQVNYKEIIKSKEIIIVESIGDMLSLWEAGIKHSVVTFGVRMSPRLLTVILKINPDKITVALNNDGSSTGAGNQGADNIFNNLLNHFDKDTIQMKLPTKNDFGCMNKEEILQWQNK